MHLPACTARSGLQLVGMRMTHYGPAGLSLNPIVSHYQRIPILIRSYRVSPPSRVGIIRMLPIEPHLAKVAPVLVEDVHRVWRLDELRFCGPHIDARDFLADPQYFIDGSVVLSNLASGPVGVAPTSFSRAPKAGMGCPVLSPLFLPPISDKLRLWPIPHVWDRLTNRRRDLQFWWRRPQSGPPWIPRLRWFELPEPA